MNMALYKLQLKLQMEKNLGLYLLYDIIYLLGVF